MFGVDTTELLLIAVAALIFIGPKDLPRAMRTVEPRPAVDPAVTPAPAPDADRR